MDQVAEVVVVIAAAVVGFQAVVGDGRAVVIGQDIVRGVEGEHFIARLGNPAQFVVFEVGRSCPLVGTVGQVAGTVVAVASFDGIDRDVTVFLAVSVCDSSLSAAICLFRRPKGSSSSRLASLPCVR